MLCYILLTAIMRLNVRINKCNSIITEVTIVNVS